MLKKFDFKKLSEAERKAIIIFYETHSLRETCLEFNIKNKASLKKWLIENSVEIHSRQYQAALKRKKIENTNLLRYGVINAYQIKKVKAKAIQSCKDNAIAIHNKIKATCKNRYGNENYNNQEKIKETRKGRYGVENFFQDLNIHTKAIENASSADALAKKEKTCSKRFGYTCCLQDPAIREKGKSTLFNKYGVYHTLSNRFIYNNLSFDSFPELCFYLYCVRNNIDIKKEPVKFEYIYNNKKYYYIPDFEIASQLYEIKGDQFLADSGIWCNPYDHSLDEQFKAKYFCAKAHNVIILYSKDYQKYIDWFKTCGYKKEDFIFTKIKS